MKELISRGRTGNVAFVFLQDTTSSTGGGKTGLTNASAGLLVAVRRTLSATMTAYSGANIGTIATLGTWVDPGAGKCNFREVDSTNAPGVYELHFTDDIFGTSDASRKLIGMVQATGIAPTAFEMELTAVSFQDGVRFGLSALPNAAAGVSGGLPAIDANLEVKASTLRTNSDKTGYSLAADQAVNATKWAGTVIPAPSVTGVPKVDVVDIAGATVASGTAQLGVNVVTQANIDFGALQKASLNAATPASVVGAVGSVAGNVVGSVGSLAAQAQTDVESALAAQGLTTARAAKLDDLDAAVSSRLAAGAYTAPDNADIATILTDVAAILVRVDVTLSTRLATLGYTAPDNADIATVLTDVGTLLTRIDVTLSTRLASGDYTAPDNADVAAIKVVTDALPVFPADPASNSHIDSQEATQTSFLGGTIADTQDALVAEIDTRLASSDYVAPANPDVSALAHLDVDVSTRLASADYVAPQNPDVSALELLDVAVSTRLASGDYTAPDNTDVEAIRAWIASLTEPISLNLESAVGVDGSVKVRRGDSYTTGSKHGPLVWPGTATVWGAYVGIACVFTARDPNYRGRSFALGAIFEDMGEGVIQCRVELPSLATGSLSDQSIEEPWDFDVQATEDTLVDVTPIFGIMTILKDVTPPSVG